MKPTTPAAAMTSKELAAYIDHSILKPEFTIADVERETRRAVSYGCRTVCINPASVAVAKPLCEGTDTGVCVVIDFPFGASTTASKVAQTKIALAEGIDEVDIVANFGWVRSGEMDSVTADLRAVVEVCHAAGVPVKVIFETDALTHEEIRATAEASITAGADYIKTSTGFFTSPSTNGDKTGAFEDMAAYMIDCAAGRTKVKGSGAIRDREHFLRLIDLGIDRMGIGYRSTALMLGVTTQASPSDPGDAY